MKRILAGLTFFLFSALAPALAAETPPTPQELPMGTHHVTDSQGRKAVVYTTGGPSARSLKAKQKAEEERRLILERLPSVIIDARSRGSAQSTDSTSTQAK